MIQIKRGAGTTALADGQPGLDTDDNSLWVGYSGANRLVGPEWAARPTANYAVYVNGSGKLASEQRLALSRGGSNADLSATGGSGFVLKQSSAGAAVTVAALLAADVPALDASKLTTGQLAVARGGTGLDGSATGGANQVVKQTTAAGAFTVAVLAAADLPNHSAALVTSGTLDVARGGTGTGTAFTSGNIVVAGASGVYVQNSNLCYNNGRLGVGVGASPDATLDAIRGTGTSGTCRFQGTTHSSHFHYSTTEDCYLRAGKTGAVMNLNDNHNGNVTLAAGGGNIGLGTGSPGVPIDCANPVGLKSYTVATLPAAGTARRIAYASNGRKAGEGAGAGTGVLVFDDATAWRACDTGLTVAA